MLRKKGMRYTKSTRYFAVETRLYIHIYIYILSLSLPSPKSIFKKCPYIYMYIVYIYHG